MLENLLADFNNPCILDMKLGRKQRAFDCTEAKRQLLESRCANSTSASLGFRICGMQVKQHLSFIYHAGMSPLNVICNSNNQSR